MQPAAPTPSPFRMVLLPAMVALAITIARLTLEVQGSLPASPGGNGTLLGISWLIPVVGAWLGWRLARWSPRRAWAPLWFLLRTLIGIGFFALNAGRMNKEDPPLREIFRRRSVAAQAHAIHGVSFAL